jgi:serine/threonine protein kinase
MQADIKCMLETGFYGYTAKDIRVLGKGDLGIIYTTGDTTGILIKAQSRDGDGDAEAEMSYEMHRIGVGPEISGVFECGKRHYIMMEEIRTLKANPSADKMYEGFTDKIQLGFVNKLKRMIDNGYIHCDNHEDNIGFNVDTDEPVLFDFGFTRHVEAQLKSKRSKEMALAFSVGILLQNVNRVEKYNCWFQTFSNLIDGTYDWKTGKCKRKNTKAWIGNHYRATDTDDILAVSETKYEYAARLYAYTFGITDFSKRNESPAIDEIYTIRRNEHKDSFFAKMKKKING